MADRNSTPTRVAIYARVSTPDQSTDSQTIGSEEVCLREGLEVLQGVCRSRHRVYAEFVDQRSIQLSYGRTANDRL